MTRPITTAFTLLTVVVSFTGCGRNDPAPVIHSVPPEPGTVSDRLATAGGENPLLAARKGHKVVTASRGMPPEAPDTPPNDGVFQLVKYPSPVGDLAAYLTPDPKDGQKRPAIIWITGGDCNSIGDVWSQAPADNDQTAVQYRAAGVVMMFPSLRGGNRNPGQREGFFGEVDDVLAAKKFLAEQPHVDPNRIYLGGHSTGGTLALLVAETGADFRSVFSFGPVHNVAGYGPEYCPFDLDDEQAIKLRSPGYWLGGIRCRTLVIEGAEQGNSAAILRMSAVKNVVRPPNDRLLFYLVGDGTHFSILAPLNEYLANQILADTGPVCEIALPDRKPVGNCVPGLVD